nr:Chain PAA, GAKSAA Peptide [synthetic construct]7QO2_PAB Chain PAB, GAKSAA Peptide [synthetic construct]
GAKSAA